MATTPAYIRPPLQPWLDRTALTGHAALAAVHAQWQADPSLSKPRKDSKALGGWGDTTQREKERLGILQTWTDGANVRVSTVSIYLHLLDLIAESHPIDGPPRKARTPVAGFRKGHVGARKGASDAR
jgi:hypothetical protein